MKRYGNIKRDLYFVRDSSLRYIHSLHLVFNYRITHPQLELRKKQFHVLLSTIQELQQTLESK